MVDKVQIGAFLIVLALLMMASPFALAKAFTTASSFALGMSAILVFYSIILILGGVACFYIKPEEAEAVE